LFITCYHTSGADEPETKLIQKEQSVVIDLSDEVNLTKVRLYLTENNTASGTELCFEEIGVIANGQKGDKGDDAVITEAIKTAIAEQAAANLQNSFYTKDQIDQLEKDIKAAYEAGDSAALADAAAALAKANEFNGAITTLQGKFNADGTIKSGVLKQEDIYNLSKAALGANLEVGPNDISADSVFTKYVAAVVGNFVKIKAEDIESETLTGVTVKSESGSWQLNNDGSAMLGNNGINIKSDGSVTFGSGVSLK
jgi:hypothetical protein